MLQCTPPCLYLCVAKMPFSRAGENIIMSLTLLSVWSTVGSGSMTKAGRSVSRNWSNRQLFLLSWCLYKPSSLSGTGKRDDRVPVWVAARPSAPTRKDGRDRQPPPEQHDEVGTPPVPSRNLCTPLIVVSTAHSEHRFPAPSSKRRKDVVNQCLEFVSTAVRGKVTTTMSKKQLLKINSAARRSIQLWEPSSTSLLFVSPSLPAPPPCSWSLLVSQLHLGLS